MTQMTTHAIAASAANKTLHPQPGPNLCLLPPFERGTPKPRDALRCALDTPDIRFHDFLPKPNAIASPSLNQKRACRRHKADNRDGQQNHTQTSLLENDVTRKFCMASQAKFTAINARALSAPQLVPSNFAASPASLLFLFSQLSLAFTSLFLFGTPLGFFFGTQSHI